MPGRLWLGYSPMPLYAVAPSFKLAVVKQAAGNSKSDGWKFLKPIREASRLAKALSTLAVSLVILVGLAVGLGPLPNVPATLGVGGGPSTESSGGDSAQSRNGDSTVSSGPVVNLILGSSDVHVCRK